MYEIMANKVFFCGIIPVVRMILVTRWASLEKVTEIKEKKYVLK